MPRRNRNALGRRRTRRAHHSAGPRPAPRYFSPLRGWLFTGTPFAAEPWQPYPDTDFGVVLRGRAVNPEDVNPCAAM